MLPNMVRRLVVTSLAQSSHFLLIRLPGYRRSLSTILDEQSTLQLVQDYYHSPSCSGVKVIMDIGANVGQSTETFLRLFPESHIYSVEPASDVYKRLRLTFEADQRVTPLHYAASNQDGLAKLYHSEFSVASSLKSPWKSTGTSESVPSRRLATICRDLNIRRINILKVDTEGHELMVLRGAEEMLSDGAVDIIIVECGFKPNDSCHSDFYGIANYLQPFAFNLSGFTEAYNFEWNQIFSLLYCNAIFTRSSS